MITITADFERQNDSCQGTQEGRSPGLSSTKRLKAGFAMAHVKETTRATLMMLHGFCMSMLGMLLLHVRETMAHFYAFGCALAMLLIAASLIMLAALDWICVVGQGAEQASKLRGILSISVGAAFGGVVLALYPGATISLFCYLIAFYALLLSFAKFNLARYWSGPERARNRYVRAGSDRPALWHAYGDYGWLGRTQRDRLTSILFSVHGRPNAPHYFLILHEGLHS